MVDGSVPGQVTDMLVVFKTPAWVLEIAGKHTPNASADHHIDSYRGLCASVTSPAHAGK